MTLRRMITSLFVEATEREVRVLNTYFYVELKKAIKCYVKHARSPKMHYTKVKPILIKTQATLIYKACQLGCSLPLNT